MTRVIEAGDLSARHLGRTIALNDAAGRLAEGRHEHGDWFALDTPVEVLDA